MTADQSERPEFDLDELEREWAQQQRQLEALGLGQETETTKALWLIAELRKARAQVAQRERLVAAVEPIARYREGILAMLRELPDDHNYDVAYNLINYLITTYLEQEVSDDEA